MVDVRTPVVVATIERRVQVVYRLDHEVAAAQVPNPFSPLLVGGDAVGLWCSTRLRGLRPRGVPAALGLATETVSHRIAVQWRVAGGPAGGPLASGTFVVTRASSSPFVRFAGDRLFPGPHERDASHDPGVSVADHFDSQLFASMDDATRFLRRLAIGYSMRRKGGLLDGVELRSDPMRPLPARVAPVPAGVFDDPSRFPSGSAALDCALLVSDVHAEWRAAPSPIA